MWHRRSAPGCAGLTSVRVVSAAMCVLAALWGATPSVARAQVAELKEKLLPIYSLPKKPTKERILEFLKGGVVWGTDERYTFMREGTASVRAGNGSGGCKAPARSVVNADSIQFECLVESRMPASKRHESFKLEVVLASADLLVYREGNVRWVVGDCEQQQGGARSCVGDLRTLVELIPGTGDRTLYDKVRNRVRRIEPGDTVFDASSPLVVEGSVARTQRVESEVFYANGKEGEAQELSRMLRPLIGLVPAKPWPGECNYDVVVVVGSKAAEPTK